MSSLSAERDRIQREVEELEQSLSVTQAELELLSSGTDDGSDNEDVDGLVGQSAAGLLAERERIQKQIQNLEDVLRPHTPTIVSDDDGSSSESDLGLSPSVDSCLQMNLVYQQVVQETLEQLEKLLAQNQKEQEELVTQLSGPTKEPSKQKSNNSSYKQPEKMYLGHFLKPYFKDKLTGLGPPANQEARERASRMLGHLDEKKLKLKRWESWQKTLLIHSVSREGLKRLIQPKLSKVDYLSQKLLSAHEAERQLIKEQVDSLESEINQLRQKKEEELIGDRYEEHDWQKISNIDFEGTRDAGDIRCFWQNFLHPHVNKTRWSQEEVQQLKEISRRHGERHWETISQELGTGRTAFMCLQMFQRFISDSLKRRHWTPAEDTLFRELVEKMRIGNFIPYTQISYFMDGRDPAQLLYRWTQVLDPSLKKGPWTREEDKLLLQAVARYGEKSWSKIRLAVPGRSDGGCRDRYYDCLKAGTKRGAFDKHERELLLQLVEKHGVGHWAKIAAEIPNRIDSQCMREWRKMTKSTNEKLQPSAKLPRRRKRDGKKKAVAKTTNKIQRRLRTVKEVVTSEEEEEEEEETVIEYMDSDDDKKQKMKPTEVVKVEKPVEVEVEEEEELYTLPSMKDWIPAESAPTFSFLNFRPVVLASSSEACGAKPVRSTIVGKFGRSVIIGPQPRELRWEERHNSSAMMMVSPDQLRAYLQHHVQRFKKQGGWNSRSNKPILLRGLTDQGLDFALQAAVTPWIGNLLIPASTKVTAADVLRERGEKRGLASTSTFTLFLQVMNVDVKGCKEMIEQREKSVMFLTPPQAPSSVKLKKPHTVGGMLQRLKLGMQEVDRWQRLTPPSPLHPLMPPQRQPIVAPQAPPNASPPVVPVPAVITRPVTQSHTASSPAHHTSPHAGVSVSPFAAPSALLRLAAPPVSVIPMFQNVTPICSRQPLPLAKNITVLLPPSVSQPVSVSSTLAYKNTLPSSAARPGRLSLPPTKLNSPRENGQAESCEAACGSRSSVDFGLAHAGVNEDRNRTHKLNQKSSAPARAAEAKAEVKKTVTSSSLHTDSSTAVPCPPRQLSNASVQLAPQTLPSALATPPAAPPDGVTSSSSSLASLPPRPDCSDWPLNHGSAPPRPSSQTTQHTVSSNSCPPVDLLCDHDYTVVPPGPTPCQSGHVPKQANGSVPDGKAKGRKRGREAAEKQQVMGSQDDHCVGRERKRVRKLSHKAKALLEESEAKAEAKKEKTSAQKRSRSAGPKQKASAKTPGGAQVPGLYLLPNQPMFFMTPAGLVQLTQAPPQGLEFTVMGGAPRPPGNVVHRLPIPPRVHHARRGMQPLAPKPSPVSGPVYPPEPPPQPAILPSVLDHGCYSLPFCPPLSVTVDSTQSSPPRREALQIDPSLMFLEPPAAVYDWLSGRGGVEVPGAGVALPYLPPFVSNLNTLSALLRAKKSLTRSSLQLLREGNRHQRPQTTSKPHHSAKKSSNQPPTPPSPDLPDSTLDLPSAEEQPASPAAPSVSSDPLQQQEEEEEDEEMLVAAVRQLVAERFSSNPAYQLLKARFLSCFTLPALLATLPPKKKAATSQANHEEEAEEEGEEEGEEEAVLEKIKARTKWSRAKRSLLLCDSSGAPASHFSGIVDLT